MKERTLCKRIQKRTPEGVLDRSGIALYGVVDQRIILRDVQGVPADALEIGEQLGEHHADLAGDVLFLHALHLTAAQVHAPSMAAGAAEPLPVAALIASALCVPVCVRLIRIFLLTNGNLRKRLPEEAKNAEKAQDIVRERREATISCDFNKSEKRA